jgi:hypothetical protein
MLLWLSAASSPAHAAARAEVVFPLGAHYRVGRYVPVRVTLQDGAAARVDAPGVVPTVVRPDGRAAGQPTVPLLVVTRMDGPRTPAMLQQVMRPLEDDERLVGVAASPDADVTASLFPGKRVIAVALELSDPLPGPAMAWGSLDAVLLDEAAAARVSDRQLEGLRASGVAVAIRSAARPAGEWGWERRGGWWVLPPDERAVVRLVQPTRYATAGETAGAPAQFRRVIVVSLTCFAIGALAASLWRDRRAWMAVVAVSVLAAGGIAAWNARQPTSATVMSAQKVAGPWLDQYVQDVARANGVVRHPIVGAAAWPILFSPRHASALDLTLECRADGTPAAFVAALKRGQSMVFLNRFLADLTPDPAPATSPAGPPR